MIDMYNSITSLVITILSLGLVFLILGSFTRGIFELVNLFPLSKVRIVQFLDTHCQSSDLTHTDIDQEHTILANRLAVDT